MFLNFIYFIYLTLYKNLTIVHVNLKTLFNYWYIIEKFEWFSNILCSFI